MTKQEPQTASPRQKWVHTKVCGKQLIWVNEYGGEWVYLTARNETDALMRKSELDWLIKCAIESSDFNKLCAS